MTPSERERRTREALEAAERALGASHIVEDGPNARWIDVEGDLYYEDDSRCLSGCAVCAALESVREALASFSGEKGSEG